MKDAISDRHQNDDAEQRSRPSMASLRFGELGEQMRFQRRLHLDLGERRGWEWPTTALMPCLTSLGFSQTHARIEHGIEEVDDQADGDDQQEDDNDQIGDDRPGGRDAR
jgi:hypothetical protein